LLRETICSDASEEERLRKSSGRLLGLRSRKRSYWNVVLFWASFKFITYSNLIRLESGVNILFQPGF
jgi:hypothetical protein